MPSKYLGLFGAEMWGDLAGGSWRAHVEYADTACDFLNDPPEFGCASTHSIYTSGYRYRGRVQGHSMDADGESIGGGMVFIENTGHRWYLLVRNQTSNRAGVAPGHSLAAVATDVQDVALTHERAYAWGNITTSLGYSEIDPTGTTVLEYGVRGVVSWRHAFQ